VYSWEHTSLLALALFFAVFPRAARGKQMARSFASVLVSSVAFLLCACCRLPAVVGALLRCPLAGLTSCLVLSYTRLVLGERSPLGRAAALLARGPPPTTANWDRLCGADRHPSSPFALSGSSVGQRGIFAHASSARSTRFFSPASPVLLKQGSTTSALLLLPPSQISRLGRSD
jgi:hypothetical protein